MDPQQGNAVVLPYTRTTRSTLVINQCLQKPAQRPQRVRRVPSIVTGCCGTSWWRRVGYVKSVCPRGRTPYTTALDRHAC